MDHRHRHRQPGDTPTGPRPEFDIYRHLSPIVEMWGTAEIRLWAAHAAVEHPDGTPRLPRDHQPHDVTETPAEQVARFADEILAERTELMNRLRDA